MMTAVGRGRGNWGSKDFSTPLRRPGEASRPGSGEDDILIKEIENLDIKDDKKLESIEEQIRKYCDNREHLWKISQKMYESGAKDQKMIGKVVKLWKNLCNFEVNEVKLKSVLMTTAQKDFEEREEVREEDPERFLNAVALFGGIFHHLTPPGGGIYCVLVDPMMEYLQLLLAESSRDVSLREAELEMLATQINLNGSALKEHAKVPLEGFGLLVRSALISSPPSTKCYYWLLLILDLTAYGYSCQCLPAHLNAFYIEKLGNAFQQLMSDVSRLSGNQSRKIVEKANSQGVCREGVSKDLTSHQVLMQDVFCSYDKSVRPVLQYTMAVTVTLKMFIKSFTLDDVNNVLEVHTWVGLRWDDIHLKWNPSDYGNISYMPVNNKEIWQPDLSIHNSGDMDSIMSWTRTICVVYSKGTVMCVPTAKWSAVCTADLQQWPYDKHNCTMRVGSWAHTGEMIDFVLQDGGVDLDDFHHSREWDLLNLTAVKNVAIYDCCPNDTYQTILFNFTLQRHESAYSATVIIPSLVLAVMTLLSFWLDPKPPHRLALCSISVLCHCLYLQYLGIKLPSNGTLTPVIIIFFRDSLMLTGIAVLQSVILTRLSSFSTNRGLPGEATPQWLNKFLAVVLDQRIGHIFLLGQFDSKNSPAKGDGATLIENGTEMNDINNKSGNEWFVLASIVDRLVFVIILLTYTVLFICFIPGK